MMGFTPCRKKALEYQQKVYSKCQSQSLLQGSYKLAYGCEEAKFPKPTLLCVTIDCLYGRELQSHCVLLAHPDHPGCSLQMMLLSWRRQAIALRFGFSGECWQALIDICPPQFCKRSCSLS